MAAAGSRATVQVSAETVTLISALPKNKGGITTKTQGVQLPSTPTT